MLIIVGQSPRSVEIRVVVPALPVQDFPEVRSQLPAWMRTLELDHFEPLRDARGVDHDVWVLRRPLRQSLALAA